MEMLFLDTETGGLDPSTDALLEVGLVHWRDGQVLDALEVNIRSEGRRVDPAALKVNRIDLEEHDRHARQRVYAAEYIRTWMDARRITRWTMVGGHNVGFDLAFLRELFGAVVMDATFGRPLDTCSILRFLTDAGMVPLRKHSLDAACQHFGIQRQRAHRALDDALATAELYGQLMEMVKGKAA